MDDQLVTALSLVADEHFRTREDVKRGREADLAARAKEDEPPLAAIEMVKSALGLAELRYLGRVGGGRSSSSVVKVHLRRDDQHEGVAILKMTSRESDFRLEREGHKAALSSWMQCWVSREPSAVEIRGKRREEKSFALLSILAFPPTAMSDDTPSLERIIGQGRLQTATRVVEALGAGYGAQLVHATRNDRSPREFVRELLKHWHTPTALGVWAMGEFWRLAGLPGPEISCFIDQGTVVPNPLCFVGAEDGLTAKAVYFRSFQHGDLNAGNLLVGEASGEGSPAIRLIDFEKAADASAVLDICWLALWSLVASRRVPPPSVGQWEATPRALVDAILGDSPADYHLGTLQLGIDLARVLFGAIHRYPDEFADKDTAGFWRNRLQDQCALTLGAASLAMAYYELRNLDRAIESGDDTGGEEVMTAGLWAVCFFRTAAFALSRYAGRSGDTPKIDMGKVLRRWIGASA
jgi:hypothetical protein